MTTAKTSSAYARVFQGVTFPLLDRLNGTSIARKYDELLELEHESPQAIRSRQDTLVTRVVEQARDHSSFYPQHWQRHQERALPSAYPALDGLPVVTKADLRENNRCFPEPAHRGRVITVKTSGSTGAPMTFYRSAEQESWFWALRFRIWSWGGYEPGTPYLTINLNPRTAWKKRLQDVLFRCDYLTFNTENQNSSLIVDLLRRKQIRHLNGFSSSLFVLAKYMLDNNLRLDSVEGITSTGDGLFPYYREVIEEAFQTRVLDYYGAGGEGIHVASQCPDSGSRYHVHPENTILEFLGPDGPVGPGESGRIVITQLHNTAMPLIRYQLDDIGAPAADDVVCPCGRTLPMIERIEGRVPDLIVVPGGGFIVPHFFVVLFKGLQEIHRYQMFQEVPERVTARLVAKPGCNQEAVERTVREDIAAATNGAIEVGFEWLDEIPLSGAGKRRLVISHASRALFESDSQDQGI